MECRHETAMDETVYMLGQTYHRLEEIPSIDSDEVFVLCEDASGTRRICTRAAWNAARGATVLPARVSHASSTQEKIALFMELFHGRRDVYAKRYYSFKTKKSGYTPACQNEWVRDLCDHRANKCPVCPNRQFEPLTEDVIRRHLIGSDAFCRDVVGIYPLLEDETTWLLCVDFDDADWQKDTAAFCETAREFGLSPAVERSRSGAGAHVWFFFEAPVAASMARKLGSGLLTRAMERWHELRFSSYDRLFPNQDFMPKGGFGNLIALPFQGQAQKEGNTLFVDETFTPYGDQWAYLSGLPRITDGQLRACVASLCAQGDVGPLQASDEERPWEKRRAQEESLSSADFPPIVRMTLADMLYVEKANISQRALNRIKRFAAFRNPDFYKAQAMRLPVYDKPRIIDCGEESDAYLILPRGCLSAVTDALHSAGVGYDLDDQRCTGRTVRVSFAGQLREEQQPAAEALLAHDTGVLSATTAFGKTVIGAYLIGMRQVNTLVLVHSTALLAQWKSALEEFLVIDEPLPEQPRKRGRRRQNSPIGQLGGGKNTLHGIVDIAIMQSLFDGEDKHVKAFVREYGMVICDECHHVAAFSFEKVLRAVRAKYVYGLSATPTRQDGHQPIIFMQCGPIRYLVDAKSQAAKRDFAHYVIPRITKTRLPDVTEIQDIYTALVRSDQRNAMILRDVTAAIEDGRTPILLTERKEHAISLSAALRDSVQHMILLLGSDSQKEKREKLDALKSVPPDESLAIVATGKYIGEGFDEPRLDTLFLTMPISWKGKLAQYVGRLHRDYEGKTDVRVYDYVDIHVPTLERMYQKRLKGYMELGYQTITLGEDASPGMIYAGDTYAPAFYADMASAVRSIVIASPLISGNRSAALMEKLSPSLAPSGVTVITRPPETYPAERQKSAASNLRSLEKAGVTVLSKSALSQNFAVFDDRVVWYGGINYLSASKAEENAIRLESPDLAGELCAEYMTEPVQCTIRPPGDSG